MRRTSSIRQQYRAAGRDQLCAGSQVDISLCANGVLRAITVRIIVGVIEEGIHGLVTFQVHNAEELPAADLVDPWVAGRYHVPVGGIFSTWFAGAETHVAAGI